MIKMEDRSSASRGFTAIFIVIFSTLLLSIIAVSFIAMMVREQSRSADDELSESAYDSALAGVEDGKRVLAACNRDGAGSQACAAINTARCNTVQSSGVLGTIEEQEVSIQSEISEDNMLNQAYTCVIIRPNTDTYDGVLRYDDSVMIPLRSDGKYDKVVVSWYNSDDITVGVNQLTYPTSTDLTSASAWGYATGHPPLIKAQLMQYDSTKPIKLSAFNDNKSAHTLYLYPWNIGISDGIQFSDDDRRDGSMAVSPVACAEDRPIFGYACNATLTLPDLPDDGDNSDRVAYLRLSNYYGSAHYQVRLLNGSTPVKIVGVQPSIDSTGRANDIFRRVEAKVESSDDTFPYPRATIDITNNLCKAYGVTDDGAINIDDCVASEAGE